MHEEVKYKCDLEQKTFEYMYDQQKSIKKTFIIWLWKSMSMWGPVFASPAPLIFVVPGPVINGLSSNWWKPQPIITQD